MRAVVVERCGGSEELRLKDVPRPSASAGEVLVRLMAAGVNPVDTYLRSGAQGYAPPLPWTPGLDGAGIVEELGEGVEGRTVGDKVYVVGSLTGTYADYCLSTPGQLFSLPDTLDWAQGASLGLPYFTAARALFTKGRPVDGESVLIHGATGGVGSACLQLAAGQGLTLLGTAGSEAGCRMVESYGAPCFDHRDPDRFAAIRNHLGGGVNLIVEMLADVNLDDDLRLLAQDGRIVVVGSRGRIEIVPRDLMGSEGRISAVRMPLATVEERRYYDSLIQEGVNKAVLFPPIGGRFPLKDAAVAHERLISGPHKGNLVLDIDRSEDSP